MSEHSPLSPEARAHSATLHGESEADGSASQPPNRSLEVVKRVFVGVYSEGFVHAGNFAYLSLVVLFSFCIVAAAIAGAFGQTQSGIALINAFFADCPARSCRCVARSCRSAMTARSGPLLWFGAAVSLWTTASLIETIRDVMHRSYGTEPRTLFWQYRLGSSGERCCCRSRDGRVQRAGIGDRDRGSGVPFHPAAEHVAGYFAWGGSCRL